MVSGNPSAGSTLLFTSNIKILANIIKLFSLQKKGFNRRIFMVTYLVRS